MTTVMTPFTAEVLELRQECLDRYECLEPLDFTRLVEAAAAADQVAAFKSLLVGENRRPMLRAIEAGLRCATRGGGHD